MPTCSITGRTAAPAMIPVPGDAGFNITLLAPNFPIILWGIVPLMIEIRRIFCFAFSFDFVIAEITSFAFPSPIPT